MDKIDVILKAYSNLLMVESDIVRLIHYLVQEFFINISYRLLRDSIL